MSTLRKLVPIVAGTIAFGASAQEQWNDSNTCNLAKTPANAVRKASSSIPGAPTIVAFPDPDTVLDSFSGCMTGWIATPDGDVRMLEAKFLDGKIKWSRMGNGEIYCEYENDRVINERVQPEMKKWVEAQYPRRQFDFQFCPKASELVPSKWR